MTIFGEFWQIQRFSTGKGGVIGPVGWHRLGKFDTSTVRMLVMTVVTVVGDGHGCRVGTPDRGLGPSWQWRMVGEKVIWVEGTATVEWSGQRRSWRRESDESARLRHIVEAEKRPGR